MNKVALITGAGSGIGKTICGELKQQDYHIVGLDINPGDDIIRCDVRSPKQISKIFARLERLDVLINCAGVYLQANPAEITAEQINAIIDTNLKAPMITTAEALPLLRETGGSIINIASSLGLVPEAESSAYCASKAGLIHFTKSVALSEAPHGVRVNAICPGPVNTPMLNNAFPNREDLQEYLQTVPLKRAVEPQEIAGMVGFLVSDRAVSMTGSIITMDSGEAISR